MCYNSIVNKRWGKPQEREEIKMKTHIAYNLTTGEILECPNATILNRCVKINNHSNGIRCDWIFGHKGINEICERANKKLATMPKSKLMW